MEPEVKKDDTGIKAMYREVLSGLSLRPKTLPSKYFYDERGSKLFDAICDLDEYYVTRTELSIMEKYMDEMVEVIGRRVMLIEYGSGSSEKIKRILDAKSGIEVYVPIDISCAFLKESAAAIARRYPRLEVIPVCADFSKPFGLPQPRTQVEKRVVYFPGSTIGNFHRDEARAFLQNMAAVCGRGSGLIIGVDLKKDERVLHAAYNDARGLTAAFNLNQLERLNRELGSDFDLDKFEHKALYNAEAGRIEMHIVSNDKQRVSINGSVIEFEENESIWTESSYKYDIEEFRQLAREAGFQPQRVWTDERRYFSIHYLKVV
ncbi:MAG TPA: L-histidine N(alpha)-methyltransferase [Caldithrix abyssi]|uniref:L-histidine N(Alpha)-methyltransferase n=1 Tax=Caldithrix abyssi TaxID=187145 RepID=A0A7V5VF62_CALAY|nr:L-histidine N(alpha)-methyltransferase [Caldithrix abyssi]